MGTILGLGIVWTLYGIAGLLGFQIIDEKYKNHEWTMHFIRYRGVSWLLIGIPWLILYFWAYGKDMNRLVMCLLLLLCGLPSIIYTIVNDRKYKDMLEKE